MGEIVSPNKGTLRDAVARASSGSNERHRLCFDFNTIDGLKQFFSKCKQAGLTHPDSAPVLLHQQDSETVWLVGLRKHSTIVDGMGETLGDV